MTKFIICKDIFGNQCTVPVDELNIRVGVYAVIIEDNKILLTRQWDGYSLIGGGVEKGKTIEESIVREFKEETGPTIMPEKSFTRQLLSSSATLKRKLTSRFSCTSPIASCTGKSITTT